MMKKVSSEIPKAFATSRCSVEVRFRAAGRPANARSSARPSCRMPHCETRERIERRWAASLLQCCILPVLATNNMIWAEMGLGTHLGELPLCLAWWLVR
jgi:hypothetical protein